MSGADGGRCRRDPPSITFGAPKVEVADVVVPVVRREEVEAGHGRGRVELRRLVERVRAAEWIAALA